MTPAYLLATYDYLLVLETWILIFVLQETQKTALSQYETHNKTVVLN